MNAAARPTKEQLLARTIQHFDIKKTDVRPVVERDGNVYALEAQSGITAIGKDIHHG